MKKKLKSKIFTKKLGHVLSIKRQNCNVTSMSVMQIYGQTVILHMLPLNYVVIILSQNQSILQVPVVKFLNELTQ